MGRELSAAFFAGSALMFLLGIIFSTYCEWIVHRDKCACKGCVIYRDKFRADVRKRLEGMRKD